MQEPRQYQLQRNESLFAYSSKHAFILVAKIKTLRKSNLKWHMQVVHARLGQQLGVAVPQQACQHADPM